MPMTLLLPRSTIITTTIDAIVEDANSVAVTILVDVIFTIDAIVGAAAPPWIYR